MYGWRGIQRPRGGGEVRGQLWLGPGDGDLLQHQPLDIVGNYPRHLQLDLCRLLRAVLWLICGVEPRSATTENRIQLNLRDTLE